MSTTLLNLSISYTYLALSFSSGDRSNQSNFMVYKDNSMLLFFVFVFSRNNAVTEI